MHSRRNGLVGQTMYGQDVDAVREAMANERRVEGRKCFYIRWIYLRLDLPTGDGDVPLIVTLRRSEGFLMRRVIYGQKVISLRLRRRACL